MERDRRSMHKTDNRPNEGGREGNGGIYIKRITDWMRGERKGREGTHKTDRNGRGNKITIGKLRNAKKGKSAPRR